MKNPVLLLRETLWEKKGSLSLIMRGMSVLHGLL
jgi:hypothetical protein